MQAAEINASIITIGDELLIGQTVDTNSAYIGSELNKIGIWVATRVAVGDVKEDILEALEREKERSKLIIITGGLGPTADDITKLALCEYFNSQLVMNEAALENVKQIFKRVNRPLIDRNIKQAEVPHNCEVLLNTRGTAPGMWFEKEGVIYISLPGVPHEMKGLMEQILPRLTKQFHLPVIIHQTLVTSGKGESEVAEHIADFENGLPSHIKLAYLPSYGMVKLRLTAKGPDRQELEKEAETYFNALKEKVAPWLVTDEDKPIQDVLGGILKKVKKFVATAESCTGGYIAHLLTEKSGSSTTFKGGVVSYANDAKEAALGVQHQTLVTYGAVSEETVIEMATGVLKLMNADYSIATSGIMGPDGGTKEKPVGTVWIAVADGDEVRTTQYFVRFDRRRNIEQTAHFAMNFLRLFILEKEGKEAH
ncbi:MAG: competence/damage-inducible protein A [Chitinophagaceae bacterium]